MRHSQNVRNGKAAKDARKAVADGTTVLTVKQVFNEPDRSWRKTNV